MSMEYKVEITHINQHTGKSIEGEDVENAVFTVHWVMTGTDVDTGEYGQSGGRAVLNTEELDLNNFTPFEDLTKETLLEWAEASIDDDVRSNCENFIQMVIQKKRRGPSASWVTQDGTL